MVRDGVLSLPTWFSRDIIDDVLSSVCWRLLFLLFLLYVCVLSPPFLFLCYFVSIGQCRR